MVLVEVARKAYLASIVPVIVNAILNEHQIVVDIVAFVNKGDFPRSRLGEKQRGKILAGWVTRKMRTMAQFGIKDADAALSDVTETLEPRHSGSVRNGSVMASSLRNVEQAPQVLEQEMERQQVPVQNNFAPLPTGISEMPDQNYNDSIVASPTSQYDDTPTVEKSHFELPSNEYENRSPELFGETTAPPRVGPKPGSRTPLPAVEGRVGDSWTLPSQDRPAGGLRVQNADNGDEEDWQKDAIMHMNLAGRS